MRLTNNTILVTGGSNGIGLAIATRFLNRDNKVIICGRNAEKLNEIKAKFPTIITKVCDVELENQRIELFEWVKTNFPELNVLVNNAGIQRRVNLVDNKDDWKAMEKEISINLVAPIHLSTLFIPFLSDKDNSAIINVTSGLAFMPPVWVPIYGATKAGLHSFTFSMREQVGNSIEIIEIIPPAVNTDLGGVGLHTFGVPLDDFGDAVFVGLENNQIEIGFGENLLNADLPRNVAEDNAKSMWVRMRNNH